MATLRQARYYLDLGIKCDEADLADTDVVVTGAICVLAGTVKAIWVGTNTLPTTGTLAVHKSAATGVNLLSDTTLNLATGLTAYVGASQTLSTNGSALKVAAGDIITATWTLTNITATDDAVFSAIVEIEPSGIW